MKPKSYRFNIKIKALKEEKNDWFSTREKECLKKDNLTGKEFNDIKRILVSETFINFIKYAISEKERLREDCRESSFDPTWGIIFTEKGFQEFDSAIAFLQKIISFVRQRGWINCIYVH